MAPGKQSSRPSGTVAGSSRPSKKQTSTSSDSAENTTHCSMQQLVAIIKDQSCKIETMVQKNVELQKEVNKLKERINILQSPSDTNQIRREQVDHGRYELRILGDINKRVYTGYKVEGQDKELLKVAIYCNGERITSGPFASAKFEILVIEGNFCASEQGSWSAETFQGSIVKAREEAGPILKDTYTSEFAEGEALLDGLIFMDNSSWVRGKKWRLGIRMLGSNGVRVREAVSNPIRVLDRHGKEKPHPPLLTDGVECLEKVGKTRALDLKKKKICTVKDFLRLYNRNPSRLLKILGINSEHRSWKAMVEHAKECDLGPKLYSYRKKNTVVFFNSVYEVIGAEFGDHYSSLDELQDSKKRLVHKWKKSFYKNIKKRNFTADFEMVNGQPLPIEHDSTGIETDKNSQQNDETSSQVIERESSSVVLKSTTDDSVHDQPNHDVSFPEEQELPNTSQSIPMDSMLPSPAFGVDFSLQGAINVICPDQTAGVQNMQLVCGYSSMILSDSDHQLLDTETDADQYARPDHSLVQHYNLIQGETSIQEMEQDGSFLALISTRQSTLALENLLDGFEPYNDGSDQHPLIAVSEEQIAQKMQELKKLIVGEALSLRDGIVAVFSLIRLMRRCRTG